MTTTARPVEVEFAHRLRALRAANGLTVRQLANRVGLISPSIIYKYETGEHNPSLRGASDMAQGLGYTLAEFLAACLRCGNRPCEGQTCPTCGRA